MKQIFLRSLMVFSSAVLLYASSGGQRIIPLYDAAIPNSKPFGNIEKTTKDAVGNVIIRDISIPTLEIYLPSKKIATGVAVIICPGGGYWVNAIRHEGTDVAKEFVKKGVAAFVLKYRLPDDRWMIRTAIGPLQDAQRAMYLVRTHAKAWNIDPGKIGIMGFSAGGHLAASLGTHDERLIENPAHISLQPDFMILVYPLISCDTSLNGKGVIEKLLGKEANDSLVRAFSNEKMVTGHTPPAIIIQSTNDNLSVKNSIIFYEALIRYKVAVEMHLYQGGGHGYGLNNKTTTDKWMDRCLAWMAANGWMKRV